MKRLAGLLLAAATAGVATAPRVRAQAPASTRTLSLASLAPAGSTWMRVFEAWNREVRRRTNNTLQFRFYPGGVQGDESELIRKLRTGRLDAAAVTAVGLAQIYRPALALQIPGMFDGYPRLDATRTAMGPDFDGAFNAAGFQLMGWADVGRSRFFSQTAVHTPQEMTTTRPYVWRDDQVLPAFYSVAGVTPVPMQLPEVLGALQTRRVNAVLTPPVSCVSLQWATHMTHMMDMPIAMVVGATVLSRTAFQSLSPDQQTVLRESAAQIHALARRNLRADEARALTTLPTRNVTFVALDAAQRTQWEAAFRTTRTQLVGRIADAAFIERVARGGAR